MRRSRCGAPAFGGALVAVLCIAPATMAAAELKVTTQPASGVISTGATLAGSFTPNSLLTGHPGEDTTYRFEYGTTRHYGSKTVGRRRR
jgi:hypothetical protein